MLYSRRDRDAWRRVFSAAVLLLLLSGCGTTPPKDRYRVYHTVDQGETLYSIAWRYGDDFQDLADWNGIGAPYRIFPGQRLLVIQPNKDLSSSVSGPAPVLTRGHADGLARPPKQQTVNKAPPPEPQKVVRTTTARQTKHPVPARRTETKPVAHGPVHITWRWPTRGKVVQGFSPAHGKKGVDIAGTLGQPVYAAAGGEVVYSGNGLIGYGNLLIVKHSDLFLSAYGHNERLLVKEGDRVKAGEKIAEMGQTAKEGSILHFEIRRKGKPVNPSIYLPRP